MYVYSLHFNLYVRLLAHTNAHQPVSSNASAPTHNNNKKRVRNMHFVSYNMCTDHSFRLWPKYCDTIATKSSNAIIGNEPSVLKMLAYNDDGYETVKRFNEISNDKFENKKYGNNKRNENWREKKKKKSDNEYCSNHSFV